MSRTKAIQYYIFARLMLAPIMLWTITTLVFLLLRATPGDPADAILGARASQEAKEDLRRQLGLNDPLIIQYLNYILSLLRLDLGNSYTSRGLPVVDIIRDHFPATLELSLCGMFVAIVVGTSIGIFSASRPNTVFDVSGRLFGIITYALPVYWVGMILQLIFSVNLGWFPTAQRFNSIFVPNSFTGLYTIDSILEGSLDKFLVSVHHLALPSLTLGFLLSGIFERIVRVNLKQTLQADYVEAARARGIKEGRILLAHALKNALIPVITVLGLTFAALLGGAVLTEVTFSWPGLGFAFSNAIGERDYSTVQGIMVFFGSIVVVISIAIDIINAYIDPRIRY